MILKGDIVVVTGGGSGIGRSIAAACVLEGAQVVVTGRSEERLRDTSVRLGGILSLQADMTRESDVAQVARTVVEKFGRVDALVNNAGGAESAPFAGTSRELWDRMFALNATSAFLMTKALLPPLLQNQGRVVMIASSAAKHGAAYVAAYCASKHAMLGLTRSLAAEFGDKGLRVNAVCPGYVDTPMTERAVQNIMTRTGKGKTEVRELLAKMNPQRRLLKAEEIAEVVLPLIARTCDKNGEAVDL